MTSGRTPENAISATAVFARGSPTWKTCRSSSWLGMWASRREGRVEDPWILIFRVSFRPFQSSPETNGLLGDLHVRARPARIQHGGHMVRKSVVPLFRMQLDERVRRESVRVKKPSEDADVVVRCRPRAASEVVVPALDVLVGE